MCEICLKLTIKTPEQRIWPRSGVFTVNFEYILDIVLVVPLLKSLQCRCSISQIILVFPLLTLNKYMLAG